MLLEADAGKTPSIRFQLHNGCASEVFSVGAYVINSGPTVGMITGTLVSETNSYSLMAHDFQ